MVDSLFVKLCQGGRYVESGEVDEDELVGE